MSYKPFSSWPHFTQEEADAVSNVLFSNKVNYWTGTEGREFEKDFAAWTTCSYAIAVMNGTVALEVALMSLGLGVGDEVIVTPRTFIASVSSIIRIGATPVFADVDRESQNITDESILEVLTDKTRAILVVHLAGWPCDMDLINSVAREYKLRVVEDCAQAHGALYKGRPVGSLGDVAAWSFCQDKIMTTGGEGGMITTNSKSLWLSIWSYKDHGKSWESVYKTKHSPGFRWLHDSFGTNLRMTEMQSSIGRIQIKRMDDWHLARIKNAQTIVETCKKFGNALRVPCPPSDVEHAWYKCYVFVKPSGLKTSWNRNRIMEEITLRGVPCYSGSCPEVYLEKAFNGTEWRPENRLPVAKELGETSIMFLVHPTLTEAELFRTCDVIEKVMEQASLKE